MTSNAPTVAPFRAMIRHWSVALFAPVGQPRMASRMRYQPQRPLPLCTRPVRVAQQSWVLCCGCTLSEVQLALHYAGMEFRNAKAADAGAAAEVLRRSISELCAADHGNDPLTLPPPTKRPKSSFMDDSAKLLGSHRCRGRRDLSGGRSEPMQGWSLWPMFRRTPGFVGLAGHCSRALEARAIAPGSVRSTPRSTARLHDSSTSPTVTWTIAPRITNTAGGYPRSKPLASQNSWKLRRP